MKLGTQNVPDVRRLKPIHTASKTTRSPPRAAPIAIPRDTPFESALVGVVTGIEVKLDFVLAATEQSNQM